MALDFIDQFLFVGRTKATYGIVFGLAPFFQARLRSTVNSRPEYVVCFDEGFNTVLQKSQLDVYLRFWDLERGLVQSRYLGAEFLSHARADDLQISIRSALEPLDLGKLLQISMDGPTVNWKFFEKFSDDLSSDGLAKPLNIGSCGLHVVHGAFMAGHKATPWKLDKFMKNMYYLFKDTRVRRASFVELTG